MRGVYFLSTLIDRPASFIVPLLGQQSTGRASFVGVCVTVWAMSALVAFAWRLKSRLEYLEISQRELIRRMADHGVEVTPAAVCRWINARAYPNRDALRVLLNVLEYRRNDAERIEFIKAWAGQT